MQKCKSALVHWLVNRTISRQLEVVREVDLDAMALANGDRGQAVQKPVENVRAGLGQVARGALSIGVERGDVIAPGAHRGVAMRKPGNGPHRERGPEDLRVVAVHLIAQAGLSYLIEAMK